MVKIAMGSDPPTLKIYVTILIPLNKIFIVIRFILEE
mgnify:CR=1 FL=1